MTTNNFLIMTDDNSVMIPQELLHCLLSISEMPRPTLIESKGTFLCSYRISFLPIITVTEFQWKIIDT